MENKDIKDKGTYPEAPRRVKYNKDVIVWEKPKSDYIVGYRIYEARKEGDTFKRVDHTTKTEYTKFRNNSAYYITAVDYFGRESEPSPIVIIGEIKSKNKDKDKDKNKNKDHDRDSGQNQDNHEENDDDSNENNQNENEND